MAYAQSSGGTSEHPEGTKVLVLGILSIVICGLLGPFAWVIGNRVLREIDQSGGRYSNRGTVNAGRICGMIATILLLLGIVASILLIAAGASSDSTSALGL